MASSNNQVVILLSVMPRFAEAIMDGSKSVEFRRAGIPESVRYVVVYASSPVQRVIGYFEVERLDIASPSALWERHGRSGVITRANLRRYFKGVSRGMAIEIRCAYQLVTPMTLDVLNVRPPQSFCYLPQNIWSLIKRRKSSAIP